MVVSQGWTRCPQWISQTLSKWFDRGTQELPFNQRQKVVLLSEGLNHCGTNGRKSVGCWGDMLGFTVGPDRGSRKIDSVHGVLRERFFLEWDGGRCEFDW